MTRNDSFLNTGMSSASFAKTKEKMTEKQETRNAKRILLEPAGEILMAQFKNEIHQIINSPYEDEEKMSDEQFRAERRARRLTVQSLLTIQRRVAIIMRKPQDEPPKNVDGFGE